MRTSPVAFGWSAGLYLLLAIALTWPLILHPGSRVPNDLGDSMLNMLLIAQNAREVPLTQSWWDLPQFYPLPGVMAFSEHLLGLSIVTTPVMLLTGNVILAYNVAFFLSFPLCALTAHLLAYELTRRHSVSVLAGIAFGFAPYRMAQFAHIQVLSGYWIPLILLGLHLYVRRRQMRWAVLFAFAWMMQALACGYYFFYVSALVGLWLLWFGVGRLRWSELGKLLVVWVGAVVALLPVMLGYLKYQTAYGFKRWPDEIEAFSADVASLLAAPGNLRLWGWLNVIDRPESTLFPGIMLPLLIVTGALLAWSAAAHESVGRLKTTRILATVAVLFAAVAATPLWFGAWRIEIAGLRLLSVGTPHKPLSIAILLLLIVAALHPSVRAGWRRRSPLAFYTIAAIVMWLFCLGPAPTLMNRPFIYKAPYSWLMLIPGVDGVRVPARFWVLSTICLAIAGAIALNRVTLRWRVAAGWLPAAVALVVLVESWPRPLTLEAAPAERPAHTRAVARLELPFSPGSDLIALYRAVGHRRPVFNGYSGYFAPHYGALQYLLGRHDAGVLEFLTSFGPIEVVVDHQFDPEQAWRRYIGSQPNAELVHAETAYSSYRLSRTTERRTSPPFASPPLPIASIVASRYQDRVGAMLDGDRITRWDTGIGQDPTNVITIDLGTARTVEGVETQIGGFVADFPRELVIEVSDDGQAWRGVWTGSGGLPAIVASFEDPLRLPLRFPLGNVQARYIRLRQIGRDPVFYWSIAELKIHGR
jgi:hypothetical protein